MPLRLKKEYSCTTTPLVGLRGLVYGKLCFYPNFSLVGLKTVTKIHIRCSTHAGHSPCRWILFSAVSQYRRASDHGGMAPLIRRKRREGKAYISCTYLSVMKRLHPFVLLTSPRSLHAVYVINCVHGTSLLLHGAESFLRS
jgi:hypothetical protein